MITIDSLKDTRLGQRNTETGEITRKPESDMLGGALDLSPRSMLDLGGGYFVYLPDGVNGEPLHALVADFKAAFNIPRPDKAPAELQAAPPAESDEPPTPRSYKRG